MSAESTSRTDFKDTLSVELVFVVNDPLQEGKASFPRLECGAVEFLLQFHLNQFVGGRNRVVAVVILPFLVPSASSL